MNKNINSEYYSIPSFLDSTTKITIGTAIIYIIIAKLTQFIFIPEINLPPFFPAIGFAVATVMIFGRKAILGIAIGSFIFTGGLLQSDLQNATSFGEFLKPLLICFIRPLIASLNAFIVYYLSQRWCKNKYPFEKGINVLYFASACLLGSIISVSIGIIPLAVTSSIPIDNLILMWSNWFRGNALGAILFAPLVLSWIHKPNKAIKWSLSKKIEFLILTIATVVFSLLIFKTSTNNESIVFFILLWAAYRFGTKVISLVFTIISIIAIYCTGHHQGGFIFNGWNSDFLMLQLFLFVNMVSILFLKAILREKENEQYKLKISEEKLNIEKNILEAIIESPNGISIYSLDTNFNYLSYNSAHKNNMKDQFGIEIKTGLNLIECINDPAEKERIHKILRSVLNGNIYTKENKSHMDGECWDIVISPIKDKENNVIGTTTVSKNVSKLKLSEIQLEKNNKNLNERIKELTCLYKIFEISNNNALSESELVNSYVKIIPQGLQFPEITNCRILIQGQELIADKDQKTNWFLQKTITVNGEKYGAIEVGYLEEKQFENIFLVEEVQLLETIANILSKSLESNLAVENLKTSEENHRILFENVQDVFFKTSIKTKAILDVSPSCSSFNGITREELIGQQMSIIYSDKDQMQLMFNKVLTENKIIDFNNEITIKGEIFYVSINAKIICDENGEPDFVVGSLRDITERRLAGEKLKISEENYRNLFENVQDVFFKSSFKTETILDVSPSCGQFNGITREELIGQNMLSIYTDENEVKLMLDKLLREHKITDYNNKIVIKGQFYHISINASIIFDENGDPEFVVGALRDITERRLTEENLKISEEKFRSIYESFDDVYFKTKIDGAIQELSPSFEKHFLKPCAQAIGSSVLDLYYDKNDRALLLEKLKIENQVSDFDAQFKDVNGNTQFFSINAHFLYDEGIPVYIEGTLRNINDRIASQKEMTVKNRKLEFQNTELEQFAYIASHDLQEPLITVIHSIQMLEEEIDEKLNEEQKKYLQFINSSTSRMQLLVKGLLDYSQIGKERKSHSINCNEIVGNVLADMNSSLKESGAVVEYENLPIIEGNRTEIRQLFQNLISNANKYRKNDRQPKIKIAAAKEEKNWQFSIEDNGIGINEKDIDKVFVIFKRLHNRSEYSGTGIGLSHCKKIIEQHKGKIWAESKINEGSTFKWTFPIEQN